VVPDGEVEAHAQQLAERLADGPTVALGRTRRLLNDAAHRDLGRHLDAEAAAIADSVSGPEGQEGVAAFLERRPPRFRGADGQQT
jgi:2-(1,2-epoxy-1,2-dihydrophenyl)acetyl-CoA isomerase